MIATDHNPITLRNQPVQARANERIESLLDAAAAAISAGGYETLTTQMVAEGAGTSIGTVYRYFPDRLAVIRGLAERNTERLMRKVDEVFAAKHETWQESFRALMDAVIALFRDEPGFRVVRTGDHIGFEREHPTDPVMIRLGDMLAERFRRDFGLGESERETEGVRLGVMVAISLAYTAFSFDSKGDERLLRASQSHAEAELQELFG